MMFLRDHESSGSVAVEESPQAQARGKPAPAHWTVLAYLAGDNDLEGALLDDLKEMERVGSRPGAVEILAQLDRTPGGDASAGDWSGTRRYYVTRSASPSRIGSKLLADLGDANTGDPGVLEDFLSFGTRRFPARASMLVLSNHFRLAHRSSTCGKAIAPRMHRGGHEVESPEVTSKGRTANGKRSDSARRTRSSEEN